VAKEDLANQAADSNPQSEETKIPFLDQEISPAEYKEICDNLGAYFAILKSWRKRKNHNEEKKDI
jgi:hypothetical protein